MAQPVVDLPLQWAKRGVYPSFLFFVSLLFVAALILQMGMMFTAVWILAALFSISHLWMQYAVRHLHVERQIPLAPIGPLRPRRVHIVLPTAPRPRLPRLGLLSPRDQVLRCYAALIRHSARHGIPRVPSQTPDEFVALVAREPAVGREVQAITEAFVEGRYSRHEIGSERVTTVRGAMHQLRRVLSRTTAASSRK